MDIPFCTILNSLTSCELLEQLPDSIIFADPQGVIRYWNVASEKLFGFTAREAVGHSLDIIIPEKLREPHWRGFYAAMKNGYTKHDGKPTRTKGLHKSGKFIYAEVSFCLIKNETDHIVGSLSSARPVK